MTTLPWDDVLVHFSFFTGEQAPTDDELDLLRHTLTHYPFHPGWTYMHFESTGAGGYVVFRVLGEVHSMAGESVRRALTAIEAEWPELVARLNTQMEG